MKTRSSVINEFIPMLFQSSTIANLSMTFENGVIPSVGDKLELVCYERGAKNDMHFVKCTYRVIKKRWWQIWKA